VLICLVYQNSNAIITDAALCVRRSVCAEIRPVSTTEFLLPAS
jgi:hypothetical protein